MSFLRFIGYIGIALLGFIGAIALVIAFSNHDWYGIFLSIGLIGLLVLFVHGLHSAAQRESNPALKSESNLGWYVEPLSALFRGPVLHTPEGLIMLTGGLASILFAFLSYFVPSWIGIPPNRSDIHATTFVLWPILLFVFYIKFCASDFRSSLFSSLLTLIVAGTPFYMMFK